MKLKYKILSHLSIYLFIILGIWSIFFYITVMDEVNDETDDYLEDYSKSVIAGVLAGEEVPMEPNGSNNCYFIQRVPDEYALRYPDVRYSDEMVYIEEKKEAEPARVLRNTFKAKGDYYELTVCIPAIEKEDLKSSILNWIIFLYLSLLIAIIVVNTFVFNYNMKPLYVLLTWIKNYTIGKKIPFPKSRTRITEFQNLYNILDYSVKRNEEIFEQQKQFISNASHELQTPLAICQNRLEMLAENDSLAENELSEIIKTLQTLEHIIKLNKALLFLSKIENGQFPETQEIKMNDLIEKIYIDFNEAYNYKNVSFQMKKTDDFKININETLASALITNLLKNAYLHNYSNGKIEVQVNSETIIFRNSGDKEPLDGNQIFHRFYQARGKKENSTGLGLSIAYTICKSYNLKLKYEYIQNEHCFIIKR